jgi:hypothetical protein
MTFRVRIARIRFKRRSRYRSPQAFDLTTSRLLAAVRAVREGGE